MTKTVRRTQILTLLGITAATLSILLAGCQTVPTQAPQGLTQAEFFQRAQEAADSDNWKAALFYYRTFEKRYPNDEANIAAADYEIAFIHFRLKEYTVAKSGFEALLKKYEGANASKLPQWPEVLSRMILKEVDTHLKLDPKTDPGLLQTPAAPAQSSSAPQQDGLPKGQ
jgi:hypothetical protein